MDAELKKEIANRLNWYSRYIELNQEEQAVKSFEGIVEFIQQEIAKARIDELLRVYDSNGLYFYDNAEDPVTVGQRIAELSKTLKEHKEE